MTTDDPLLTTKEVSELIGVPVNELYQWKRYGKGPEFIQLSPRRPRYRRSDVNKWLEERRRNPQAN